MSTAATASSRWTTRAARSTAPRPSCSGPSRALRPTSRRASIGLHRAAQRSLDAAPARFQRAARGLCRRRESLHSPRRAAAARVRAARAHHRRAPVGGRSTRSRSARRSPRRSRSTSTPTSREQLVAYIAGRRSAGFDGQTLFFAGRVPLGADRSRLDHPGRHQHDALRRPVAGANANAPRRSGERGAPRPRAALACIRSSRSRWTAARTSSAATSGASPAAASANGRADHRERSAPRRSTCPSTFYEWHLTVAQRSRSWAP